MENISTVYTHIANMSRAYVWRTCRQQKYITVLNIKEIKIKKLEAPMPCGGEVSLPILLQ